MSVPPSGVFTMPQLTTPTVTPAPLRGRYRLCERLECRTGVERFRGTDLAGPGQVVILRQPADPPRVVPMALSVDDVDDDVIVPQAMLAEHGPATVRIARTQAWPGIGWEESLLARCDHPALPRVADRFSEGGFDYLVFEVPDGPNLWDAWDSTSASEERYEWLAELAEAFTAMQEAGGTLPELKAGRLVVTPDRRIRFSDLSGLVPLPVPEETQIEDSLTVPPELITNRALADGRAGLYAFGVLVQSLLLGRELIEDDFESPGEPHPVLARFPDMHPLLGRLIGKTFHDDQVQRFPTPAASALDPSGFREVIHLLRQCRREVGRHGLDVAGCTTTGMVRGGNEDVFALIQSGGGRHDHSGGAALVLLADGMGGAEGGEVAASLAVQTIRRELLSQPPFRSLIESDESEPIGPDACKWHLTRALEAANQTVLEAARATPGRRGMGCTAEAVYLDGRYLVLGHVGDSRTYLVRNGRIMQLTNDHTLVAMLVEAGQLTPDEAETHPRRSELQQAIGGRGEVEPQLLSTRLGEGDWVVVCSDGLTGPVRPVEIAEIVRQSGSAHQAARRLVNRANLRGASDNVTVAVVRVV
jgi:protein phosphatase